MKTFHTYTIVLMDAATHTPIDFMETEDYNKGKQFFADCEIKAAGMCQRPMSYNDCRKNTPNKDWFEDTHIEDYNTAKAYIVKAWSSALDIEW